jgi:hypothetical protein
MPKSFSIWPLSDSGARIRMGVVILAVANLVALYFVLFPLGGSPAELRQRADDLKLSLKQRQGALARTKKLVEKIEAGRAEGDDFLDEYFLPRRTAYSEVLAELTKSAASANVRPKESSYATEPIEGSDNLSMMQISANFEGTYTDLVRFVNLIDKSDNLLIVEGLNATPQQGSGMLNVVLKLDTFVREDEAQ